MFMKPFSSHHVRLGLGMLLALGIVATGALADELPMRKAGLWEMKMISSMNVTARHCTSPAVEKEMQKESMSYVSCSKQEIHKTASGYVGDAICQTDDGEEMIMHTEIIGDFDSAYTMKQNVRTSGGPETIITAQAKWLGACPSGWNPGDIRIDMPSSKIKR